MAGRLLVLCVLGLLWGADRAAARTNNISGTWAFSVNMENGPQGISLTFVFTQQGEKLTGTSPSGSGAERLNGTVKGEKVTFTVEGKNKAGEPFCNSYTGTIELPTSMKGTAQYVKGPATWTATKIK